MNQTLRHMSLLAVVTTILSFTSLALGQVGTCTVSDVGPKGAGSLMPSKSQPISFTVTWTGMPAKQNIPIDIHCQIKNVTSGVSSPSIQLATIFTGGKINGTSHGTLTCSALVTPQGKVGDEGSVTVSASQGKAGDKGSVAIGAPQGKVGDKGGAMIGASSSTPRNPQASTSAYPAPTY